MKGLTLLNCLRLTTLFGLMASSYQSMAIGDLVAKQSAETLNIGLIAFTCAFMLVLVTLIASKVKQSKQNKTLAAQTEELELRNALLNNFSVGIVHLNSSGEVVYANKVACYYFGVNEKQILFTPLVNVIEEQDTDAIKRCALSKVDSSVQLYIAARKRHILFNFTPQTKIKDNIACIVSLQDVNQFQFRVDEMNEQLTHNNALLTHSNLGRLSIDLDTQTYTLNSIAADMLQVSNDALEGQIKTLEALIVQTDLFRWNQAINDAKTGQASQLQCMFEVDDVKTPMLMHGLPKRVDDAKEHTQVDFTLIDQTEIYQQRSQLAIEKLKLKGLMSTSPYPTYLLDTDGVFLECNAAFEKLFKAKQSQLIGKRLKEISELPDNFKQQHGNEGSNSHSISTSKNREIEVQIADQDLQILKLHLQQYRDGNQKRAGTVGVIENTTLLKQAMSQLEQERQQFSEVLDMAPVAIATLDRDDHVIQANHAMTERLGISEKELKQASFYQLFEDTDNAGKAAKQLHQTGRLRNFQAILNNKNGELLPSALHIDLLDKNKQQFLCWISDISAQQFQQDKFDNLLEHSNMAMAVLTDSGFTQLNPAACKFFSLEQQRDLFGYFPYSECLNEDAEMAKQLARKIKQVKLDGEAQSIVWHHRKDKEPLPCHATYIPMYKGQSLDSILCVWTDLRDLERADKERLDAITLQQAAEKEIIEKQQLLESSQDQLAHKVKTLHDKESQLKQAKDSLSHEQIKFSDLQLAHQSVTDHLQTLQQDYSRNRALLEESEENNSQLESQLESSVKKVGGLERQRNQIADALQNSERQYQRAEQELAESEKNTQRLQQQQVEQQTKMDEFVAQIDNLKSSIEQKDQQILQVSGQINTLQSQLTSSGHTSEKLRQLLINQRKASEQAEKQRRALEQNCISSQSEVSNKARQIDHLKHEMQKFEEMSNQQKGDMQQQQIQLQQELEAKQDQLLQTEKTLEETKRQSDQEKAARQQQQAHFETLQAELTEVEQQNALVQQKIIDTEQHWKQQQQELQAQLGNKQQQLRETEQALLQTKQQTEAENAEKLKQQQIFEKLQSELRDMEQQSASQQAQMIENEKRWQQNQLELKREVESKQQQLQDTQQVLSENKQQTEKQKQQQQTKLAQLQAELADAEKRSLIQNQKIKEADQTWQNQQKALENELLTKQHLLLETEQKLQKTKQQTEAEIAEKKKQQETFDKLKAELSEMEQLSNKQQLEMQQNDQQWQDSQRAFKQDIEAKQQELHSTKEKLNEIQQLAENEKRARDQQQQKLAQLKVELSDVETRANKQQEMLHGSDEQWRQHHAEIEQQKQQLQQALHQAQQQNASMKEKLQGSLEELKNAESQVSETQTAEQSLQAELNQAKNEAQALQAKLAQQEKQELKLQHQLDEQQKALKDSELNINSLQSQQKHLTSELQNVQQEYSYSKQSLSAQDNSQAQLTQQLTQLEQELENSKSQLNDKEAALTEAQKQLQSNQDKLEEQEQVLVSAHEQELKHAQESVAEEKTAVVPEFAKSEMPNDPTVWFDLLSFLQKHPNAGPLPVALSQLMDDLEKSVLATDDAVTQDDERLILVNARKLAFLAAKVNSAPLIDISTRLEADCQKKNVDNISIFWPNVKQSMLTALRVIYSHLHG